MIPSTQGKVCQKTGMVAEYSRGAEVEAELKRQPVDGGEHGDVRQGHDPEPRLEKVLGPSPQQLDKRQCAERRRSATRRRVPRGTAITRLPPSLAPICRIHALVLPFDHPSADPLRGCPKPGARRLIDLGLDGPQPFPHRLRHLQDVRLGLIGIAARSLNQYLVHDGPL